MHTILVKYAIYKKIKVQIPKIHDVRFPISIQLDVNVCIKTKWSIMT